MDSNHIGGVLGERGGAVQGEMIASSPSSIPSSENNVWADASPLIDAACNDLQDGELVHGENFSLFAAMSALEIMDPKMDSGMEKSGYCSIEEAIEDGVAPVPLSSDPTINIQRTIDIIDHLFSCEATWHKGALLAQTVFSCIYLVRIERTSTQAILHSYSRIIRATCNALISAVYDARTHEEEDLFVLSYGLPLKDEMDEKSLSILNSVEETISRQLRACKAQTSKKKQFEDIESLQNNPELEEDYCRAILCRLRFRKHFFHLLTSMRKPEGRGLDLARKHIAACLSELDLMRKSQTFLQSQPHISFQENQEVNATTASGCGPVGFDSSLNTRLMSPTPPRAATILAWHDALRYFEKLLHDLDVICGFSHDINLEHILQFVVRFQKSKPDLVSRAYLQLLLVNFGKLYGKHYFYEVISRAILLPDIAKEKEFQTNQFVVQLSQLLMQLLKILCTNTSWQRRKLGKTLQDWSIISIQLELAYKRDFGDTLNTPAELSLDAKVSKRLLLWSEEQTYWIASRFLQLGFELEIYGPSEYCMVYWYMSAIYIQLLEKIQLRSLANIDISRQKGKKKKDNHRDVIFTPSCMLLQCYIYLSEGLAMILAALRNEGNAFKMPNTFNSENERFTQHFELLQKAHIPEQVTYATFHETTFRARISEVMKYEYFKEIQRIGVSLKGSFAGQPEKMLELRQIEQVAERNRIALNVISQLGAGDSSLKVSLDFTHHPYFAVLLVKRS